MSSLAVSQLLASAQEHRIDLELETAAVENQVSLLRKDFQYSHYKY